MTDKLNTCMICEEEFKEVDYNGKPENVVVVYDASYQGLEEGIGRFDLHQDFGSTIERAVYCNNCWASLVVHAWDLKDKLNALTT